jgi:hypothetical protein
LTFAQADGGIERSKAFEADRDWRHRCAGPECAIFLLKDGDEIGRHGKFKFNAGVWPTLALRGPDPAHPCGG